MKKPSTTIRAVLLFSGTLFAQVSADLSIANQNVIGTDFYFDIYLTRTGTNEVYLGTADFVLTFNSIAFTSPTVLREGSSFWNLTSTSGIPVGSGYRTATSLAPITGNEIIINLNQISFGDQTDFDDLIARIDNTPNTHRLGRYRVSGINNPSAFMNLQWKTSGTGVTTQVFTLDTVSPWASTTVTINAVNPANSPLPVELVAFQAAYKNSAVMLNWNTETELNNYGFIIERRIGDQDWDSLAFIAGHGNSTSLKEYSYTDKELFAGGSMIQYRLKQIDTDGSFEYSDIVDVEVVPDQYELSQNYPNPFNPLTRILYSIPQRSNVLIKVYDAIGKEITTIVNEEKEIGLYSINFDGSQYASGIYLYRIQAGSFVETKKMILIK